MQLSSRDYNGKRTTILVPATGRLRVYRRNRIVFGSNAGLGAPIVGFLGIQAPTDDQTTSETQYLSPVKVIEEVPPRPMAGLISTFRTLTNLSLSRPGTREGSLPGYPHAPEIRSDVAQIRETATSQVVTGYFDEP